MPTDQGIFEQSIGPVSVQLFRQGETLATRRTKNGRSWYEDVVYYPTGERLPNGRPRYAKRFISAPTLAKLRKLKQEMIDERDGKPRSEAPAMLLGELYMLVKERHVARLRPKSQEVWRTAAIKRVSRLFHIPIGELTTERIDQWMSELQAETRTVLEFADATRRVEPHHALHAPRDIDATDRQIIRQVQADGRMSFTDVANNTGISATSAADRFRKLSSDGILRVLTLPDPTRIGLNLSGVMSLQVSRPARDVIARLAAFPEVSFLCVMTGSHPVAFEFNVRDGAHFDDLRARILRTEGVLTDQTTVHRKLHRQSFVWG
jgi:Lrp/AsnC family transcriptional regulator for asnA, asnC and gidA